MTWENRTAHTNAATRRRILKRDRGICHFCGKSGADEVDHVIPLSQGGVDTDANRAAIHSDPCHKAKTQREAQAANPMAKPRRREEEAHPGLLTSAPLGGDPQEGVERPRGA